MRPSPFISRWIACLAILTFVAACGSRQVATGVHTPARVVTADASLTRIDSSIPDDPAIDSLIQPYRETFKASMSEVLAVAPQTLRTGRPEGPLGALVADIMLARARVATGLPVQIAVTNNGGLRVPLEAGEITLEDVFELMPFDNEIVVLRLTAAQIDSLANEIAAGGGEPVAGMTFTISGQGAANLLVDGEPLVPGDYWVTTSDYLAGGGGGMPVLWKPQEIRRTGILLRDAIADSLRNARTIAIPAMGRIKER